MPGIGHETEGFALVPLGVFSTTEDEPELLVVGQLGREVLMERIGGGEGVVDRDLSVRLDVGKLIGSPTDRPEGGKEVSFTGQLLIHQLDGGLGNFESCTMYWAVTGPGPGTLREGPPGP